MAGPDNRTEEAPITEWVELPPNRLVGRGHLAGDFLEAHDWDIVDESPGRLRINAHLPPHVCNPRGQLFGGFTGAYIDFVSLFATRAGPTRTDPTTPRFWLTTINMRIDYYEPIVGPRFWIEAELTHRRGRTSLVTTRLLQDEVLAVYGLTTVRSLDEEPLPTGPSTGSAP